VNKQKRAFQQKRDWAIVVSYIVLSFSYFCSAKPHSAPVLKLTGATVRCLGLGGVVVRETRDVLIVGLTNAPRPTLFGRSECVVVK
jgi:hypothetical protein